MKPTAPTGKGLVVLHGALIEQAMEERGHKLSERNARGSRDFDPAYRDGLAAAERVSLNAALRGAGASAGLLS